MPHNWSDDDDLIAYCLYRFGDGLFDVDRHELGDALGMGFSSLNLKVANYKAIDGKGGLLGYSQQAVRIYSKYNDLPDEEVREAGRTAVERETAGTVLARRDVSSASSSKSLKELEAEHAALLRKIERMKALISQKQGR